MIRLVTGGARSGKSSFAENLYTARDELVYIATSIALDEEMEERINRHQENRPREWRTYEGTYELYKAVDQEKFYILDCLTILVSNIMFDISKNTDYIDYNLQEKIERTVMKEMEVLIDNIRERGYDLTIVTNEVGCSIVPENHVSRVFRDIQGRINQRIAKLCDEVCLIVAGIAVKIK